MKQPKRGWEFFCEHANENPNICPCMPSCGCRYYSCKDKPAKYPTRESRVLPQLFLDLDGVLADTTLHFRNLFNREITWTSEDFPFMKTHGFFYRDQPLMKGALELWDWAKKLHPNPYILTGVPRDIERVAVHKVEWVRSHFGDDVQVICCQSKDKYKYGRPDDILVDDRDKYRPYWEQMGGVFVVHTSVEDTVVQLCKLLAWR